MEWGARHWSFFLFIVSTVFWLGAFITPYDMMGNRVAVTVAFGGDVVPMHLGGQRVGMWGDIPSRFSFMSSVQGVACVCLLLVIATGVGYVFLLRGGTRLIQFATFGAQCASGIFSLVAVGIYRSNSDEMGEGFWMMAASGVIYCFNCFVLLFLPIMVYEPPAWKQDIDDASTPLQDDV